MSTVGSRTGGGGRPNAFGHLVRLIDLQVESRADYHRMIAEWLPDFIAFSCNYLANVPEIVDLAKATKLALPRSFICVGGHSASFTEKATLEHAEGATLTPERPLR